MLSNDDGFRVTATALAVLLLGGLAVGAQSAPPLVGHSQGTEWAEVARLTAADGVEWDRFGYSVAISGDTAVVGMNNSNPDGETPGSAYVFERDPADPAAWVQVAQLSAPEPEPGDSFGWSVGISGDTAVVGSLLERDGIRAAAYVFERDAGGPAMWGRVATLTGGETAGAHLWFSRSVAIDGDTVVVGAPEDEEIGFGPDPAGAAYVFERDAEGGGGWAKVARIGVAAAEPGDFFGWSVAVSGDTIVVGARGDDRLGPFTGVAYVYQRELSGAWVPVTELAAADGAAGVELGRSVALSGDTTVVGASGDDDHGS